MAQKRSVESKEKSASNTQADHGPAGPDDLLVGDSATKIPDQVTHAVHAVESKRESHGALDQDLGGDGKGSESGDQRRRLQVPPKQRGSQIGGREKVQASRQSNSGDTVETTSVPGDLRTIDGKMRGNGAVQPLLLKDLGRVGGVRGGGGAPEGSSVSDQVLSSPGI